MAEALLQQAAIMDQPVEVLNPNRHMGLRTAVAGLALGLVGTALTAHEVSADPVCGPGRHIIAIDDDGDGRYDRTRCVDDEVAPDPGTTISPDNPVVVVPKPKPKPAPTTTLAPVIDNDGDTYVAPEGRVPEGTIIVDMNDASPGEGQAGIDKARELGIDVDIPEGAGSEETEMVFKNISIAATVAPADWDEIRNNFAAYGIDVMVATTLPPETTVPVTEAPATTSTEPVAVATTEAVAVETDPATSTSQAEVIISEQPNQPTDTVATAVVENNGGSGKMDDAGYYVLGVALAGSIIAAAFHFAGGRGNRGGPRSSENASLRPARFRN
ncbi:hypothetical protein BH10PAT3_BH10PAT3_7300 [soil metagenome]